MKAENTSISIEAGARALLIWDAVEEGALFRAYLLQAIFGSNTMLPMIESNCVRHILAPDQAFSYVPLSCTIMAAVQQELRAVNDLASRLRQCTSAYKFVTTLTQQAFSAAINQFVNAPKLLLTDKIGLCEYSTTDVSQLLSQGVPLSYDQNLQQSSLEALLNLIHETLSSILSSNSMVDVGLLGELETMQPIRALCEPLLRELAERSQNSISKVASAAILSSLDRIFKLWLTFLRNDLKLQTASWTSMPDVHIIDDAFIEIVALSNTAAVRDANDTEFSLALQMSEHMLKTKLDLMFTAVENVRMAINESAAIPIPNSFHLIGSHFMRKSEAESVNHRLKSFFQKEIVDILWEKWRGSLRSDLDHLRKRFDSSACLLYLLNSTLNVPFEHKQKLYSEVGVPTSSVTGNQPSLLLSQMLPNKDY